MQHNTTEEPPDFARRKKPAKVTLTEGWSSIGTRYQGNMKGGWGRGGGGEWGTDLNNNGLIRLFPVEGGGHSELWGPCLFDPG